MAAICKPEDAVVTQLVSTQTFTDTNGYYTKTKFLYLKMNMLKL